MTKWTRALFAIVGAVACSGFQPASAALAEAANAASPGSTSADAEYCEGHYEGWGVARDFAKAFACYRRQEIWLRVALMQVNGEGTSADLAAARDSLDRLAFKDADALALDKIIKKREAAPGAKARRVDFCRDVASTTVSRNFCQGRAGEEREHKNDAQLQKIKDDLDPRLYPALDRARAAFTRFVKAEGDRVYQENIDGSIRDQEALAQEARVRRHFMATLKQLVMGPAARFARSRSFSEADRELNSVYNTNVSQYVSFNERAAKDALSSSAPDMVAEYLGRNADYKIKSRAAQREWVRYRDAMGDFAAVRWPEAHRAEELARALVTEDRIRELQGK